MADSNATSTQDKAAPDQPLPRWSVVSGLKPGGNWHPRERLAGFRRLADELKTRIRDWIAAAKAAPPDADGLREYDRPFCDPTRDIAAELDLPHSKLQAWVREATGLSAGQWYDALRAADPEIGVRARMSRDLEDLLDGEPFHEWTHAQDLADRIRFYRRRRGWTTLGRAWHWGYRYPLRLNMAAFHATGMTVQELERWALYEVVRTWTRDHHTHSISLHHGVPDPALPAELNAARAARYERPLQDDDPAIDWRGGNARRAGIFVSPFGPDNGIASMNRISTAASASCARAQQSQVGAVNAASPTGADVECKMKNVETTAPAAAPSSPPDHPISRSSDAAAAAVRVNRQSSMVNCQSAPAATKTVAAAKPVKSPLPWRAQPPNAPPARRP